MYNPRSLKGSRTMRSYYLKSIRCILTALRIASKATPTSANTASHIVANPPAPRAITMILIAKARMIFCITIRLVARPILIAVTILEMKKMDHKD